MVTGRLWQQLHGSYFPTERGPCPWCMWRICRSAGSCGDSGCHGRGHLSAQCHPALGAQAGSWRWAPTGTQLPRAHLSVSPKAPMSGPPRRAMCCSGSQTPRCVWILALPLTNKLFDEPCCSSSKYKVPVGLTLDPDPFSWTWDSGLASWVLHSLNGLQMDLCLRPSLPGASLRDISSISAIKSSKKPTRHLACCCHMEWACLRGKPGRGGQTHGMKMGVLMPLLEPVD